MRNIGKVSCMHMSEASAILPIASDSEISDSI